MDIFVVILVISAFVYVGMMVHSFVNLSHDTLPNRLVFWAPLLACIVFGLSGYVLAKHLYIGWLQIASTLTALASIFCAVEIWWVLRTQYVVGINILLTESSYLMKVAFAGCTMMLVAVTTIFVPFVM